MDQGAGRIRVLGGQPLHHRRGPLPRPAGQPSLRRSHGGKDRTPGGRPASVGQVRIAVFGVAIPTINRSKVTSHHRRHSCAPQDHRHRSGLRRRHPGPAPRRPRLRRHRPGRHRPGAAPGEGPRHPAGRPVVGFDSHVIGTNGYEETAGSDVVVVTGGIARKTGMSRDDLLMINAGIVAGVVRQAAAASPEAVLIMVSNPLDAMAQVALAVSGFPRKRVIGMAGILDTARFRAFVAQELGRRCATSRPWCSAGTGTPWSRSPADHRGRGADRPADRPRAAGADRAANPRRRRRDRQPDRDHQRLSGAERGGGPDGRRHPAGHPPDPPLQHPSRGRVRHQRCLQRGPGPARDGGLVEVVEVDLAASDRAALVRSAASVEELVG